MNILSVLLALVISGTALAYGMPLIVNLQMQPAQDDAGNQLATLQAVGTTYMVNRAANLLASIPVGGNVQLTPAQLVTATVLPTSFVDGNVFGQKHVLVIAQTSAGVLEGMVYTYGGDTILDSTAIRVAEAGPANSGVVLSTDTTNFEGAAGGETVPVTAFQNATYPIAAGHISAHILPWSYAAESPFMNRYNTGNPDDNTMHTAEFMDGNNIYMGASTTSTTGGGSLNMAGGNVNAATQVTATQQVNTPTVADPTTPSYQVTMSGTSNINSMVATGNVTVDGTATATTYLHMSDRSLKENIRKIDDPLALVEALEGHKFDWIKDGSPDVGFVAQEVQRVLPEAVVVTPDGKLAVKYDIITAPLVEAVKAQARQIDRLNKVIDRKGAEIDEMRGALGLPEEQDQ